MPLHPVLRRTARVVQAPSLFTRVTLLSTPVLPALFFPRSAFACSTSTPTAPRTFATSFHRTQQHAPVWPYLYKPYDAMPHLDPVFKQVDALQETFIKRLEEAVAIPSISSEEDRRPDVVKVR
jgi:hypothetical protein